VGTEDGFLVESPLPRSAPGVRRAWRTSGLDVNALF
jgi:hypothetical protein